jgi:hypothetical protein
MAARVSQEAAEALGGDAATARSSQVVLEVAAGDGAAARISQTVIEAAIAADGAARVSQIVVECLIFNWEIPMPLIYPTLPGLTYPVGWAQDSQNTETQTATDGSEFDLGLADEPLHTFTLDYEFLNDRFGVNEQRLLRGFFGAMRSNLVRFLYWHREDHQVKSQIIGTTDGTTRIYTLKRTYGVGEASWTEAVGYLDQTQPFKVYLDTILQDPSSYTIDTTVPVQQQIIFAGTPTADQVITVDMDFFYYCKFADREMSLDKFMENLWSGSGIKLRSCRPRA